MKIDILWETAMFPKDQLNVAKYTFVRLFAVHSLYNPFYP